MKWNERDIEALFLLYESCMRNYKEENSSWLKHIITFVENCLNFLSLDERELVELYYFKGKSNAYVTLCLGYANHSSVSRKRKSIIKKISGHIKNA